MNTTIIAWVLMSYTHSSNWVPTLEFSTQAKCEAAIVAISNQITQRKLWWHSKNAPEGWCAKVEK